MSIPSITPPASAALLLVGLLGCASPSPDAAIAPVQQQLQRSTGLTLAPWPNAQAPTDAAQARSKALLATPLSQDGALELALLNHRGLQAQLADLGVTQAEIVQVSRWPNPGFTFSRTTTGSEVEWERGLHLNLGRLLVMPLVQSLEQQRLAQQQTQTTLAVIDHLAEVRRAWVEAVAAEESLRYLGQVHQAAAAGAELALRMRQAGNFNALSLAREQAFEADAKLNLARGQRQRDASRERLIRALGVPAESLSLPTRLPDLPARIAEPQAVAEQALAQRLDVQAAKAATAQTARQLGLTRTTRFVNVLDLGLRRTTTSEGVRSRAWEVGLELPLFDWGDARVARAEALYTAQLHTTADIALNAQSQVREAYQQWHHTWEIARQARDTLVPLAKRISTENLLRYNGMLIGVFELLADARAQVASVHTALAAQREFWLADADLQQALLGQPKSSSGGSSGGIGGSNATVSAGQADAGGH